MPVERRSPAVCKVSGHKEGKDEMIKASIDLQDLRRSNIRQGEGRDVLEVPGIRTSTCEPGTDRASAGRGGVGDGCTKL